MSTVRVYIYTDLPLLVIDFFILVSLHTLHPHMRRPSWCAAQGAEKAHAQKQMLAVRPARGGHGRRNCI